MESHNESGRLFFSIALGLEERSKIVMIKKRERSKE